MVASEWESRRRNYNVPFSFFPIVILIFDVMVVSPSTKAKDLRVLASGQRLLSLLRSL